MDTHVKCIKLEEGPILEVPQKRLSFEFDNFYWAKTAFFKGMTNHDIAATLRSLANEIDYGPDNPEDS